MAWTERRARGLAAHRPFQGLEEVNSGRVEESRQRGEKRCGLHHLADGATYKNKKH